MNQETQSKQAKTARVGGILVLVFVVYYLLHNDLWFWDDPRLVLGLPVGLLYHVLYCVGASVFLLLLTKYAWPENLESGERGSLK